MKEVPKTSTELLAYTSKASKDPSWGGPPGWATKDFLRKAPKDVSDAYRLKFSFSSKGWLEPFIFAREGGKNTTCVFGPCG